MIAPQLPVGYVRRASLWRQFEGILERRLTVLQAPAGFGKTTALTDVARDRRERGFLVGWISLDEDDSPNQFRSYLAYAFEDAGLGNVFVGAQDTWSSLPAVQQVGMLARAIETCAEPCLIVLDEVDRLPRRTIHLIDLLLRRAPENLHVAMALRFVPELDLAPYVLDGSAIIVGSHDLRFSRADIARFFDGGLSRRELVAVEERTQGWPAALLVYRATERHQTEPSGADATQLTENYIGVHVFRDLSEEDRTALLELSVFDSIETDVAEEVLGSSDALVRVTALSLLDGLLMRADGDNAEWRLHPLLRDYCRDLLAVEAPERKRSLHKKTALALARRGHAGPAWRQASATGDGRLVAELIEHFGVFQLWLRHGMKQLIATGRFLTLELIAEYPRLELLQCLMLRLSSKFSEANELFEAVARRTEGFTRDRDGGDPASLAADGLFTQVILRSRAGGSTPGEFEALLAIEAGGLEDDRQVRTLRLPRHILLCIVHYEHANFAESERHGRQARAHFDDEACFADVFINICLGMSAMAQGHAKDASEHYRRARRVARKYFAADPCTTLSADVLLMELDLERNREKAIQQRTLKSLLDVRSAWSDLYAAAVAVSAEVTYRQHEPRMVIQLLSEAVDFVQAMRVRDLSNHMVALLAYYLVEMGRPDEADQVWRDHRLPCEAPELVELEGKSWRMMETMSCARVRLLTAQGEYDAAELLATRICAVATVHGLTRTRLRGLALSMATAHGAGRSEPALARLAEFLHLAEESGYVGPLVRQREISRTLLTALLDTEIDEATRRAAESAFLHVDEPSEVSAEVFSSRELEVLMDVGRGLRNKEIAGRLGITEEGVRYHLKNIYRKTRLSRRKDAMRYAQSMSGLS